MGLRMRTAALCAALSLGVAPAALGASAGAPADPVDLGGTPVEDASTDPANPTRLEAGLWSDTLGGSGGADSVHQFEYERTGQDSTVHIGVVATTTEASDQVEVESEIGDTTCGTDSNSSAYNFPGAPFGAAISVQGSEQGDRNSECLTADLVTFTVSRGTSSAEGDLPVAIKIVEEAPLQDLSEDLPPIPETEPALKLPDTGTADTVTGDPSFDEAPLLEDGTHRATGTEGETLLYRVSLDWGETLAVRLDAPAMDAELEEATGGIFGPEVQLTLYDPLRRLLDTHPEGDASASLDSEEPLRLSDAAGPLRFLSRFGGPATYLPGDYWVAVAVQAGDGEQPLSFDYELTTETQGQPEGAPTYSSDDFSEPFVVGQDSFSTVASGNPAPQDDESTSNGRRLAALGLGLFGLACCGLGALQLRRR